MNKNKFTHAIMFHHFHNDKHPITQGSLSAEDFSLMIDWLSSRYRILDALEYLHRLEASTLHNNDICLTFDDALLCQYEIAAPILDEKKIKAFFFIYSSPFCGDPDLLEVFRFFRTTYFKDIDDFYKIFFSKVETTFLEEYLSALRDYDDSYLAAFPFYTKNDKWFRYLRDMVLGKLKYDAIMVDLMRESKFNIEDASSSLWMKNEDIRNLYKKGHLIGLHSYSHPTALHGLSKDQQELEYRRNFEHLRATLNVDPIAVSHPCGNYNQDTLQLLRKFGIRIGFRSNSSIFKIQSNLEVPRNDHINILKQIRNEYNYIHK